MRIALFRCEASEVIGAGHIMRCYALALKLDSVGWKVHFITSEASYDLVPFSHQFDRIDPQSFLQAPFNHELHIVDNYYLGLEYERFIRSYCKTIFVIDDLANRVHECDILLDQTYGRKALDYQEFVPKDCNILVGTKYALLRPKFLDLRQQALLKRKNTKKINKILINLGACDTQNHTLDILTKIQNSGFEGEIAIVLGFHAPHLSTIIDYTKNMKNKTQIHQNPEMADLILDSDFAIGAAGSSAWERCCLGLPAILFLTASNQEFTYQNLIEDEICFELTRINSILETKSYEDLYQKASLICDGLGTERVLSAIN